MEVHGLVRKVVKRRESSAKGFVLLRSVARVDWIVSRRKSEERINLLPYEDTMGEAGAEWSSLPLANASWPLRASLRPVLSAATSEALHVPLTLRSPTRNCPPLTVELRDRGSFAFVLFVHLDEIGECYVTGDLPRDTIIRRDRVEIRIVLVTVLQHSIVGPSPLTATARTGNGYR